MRKLIKVAVALIAVASLMFAGTSAATAKDRVKPAKSPSVSSEHKSDKNKSTKSGKKAKKAKKAKQTKKAKKVKKAKKGARVANFAPVADPSPTDAPACDPDVDVCDPSCDPMIDKLCQPVDPTCDPAVDEWCEIVIDPSPTEEPIVDPVPTPEATTPAMDAWAIYIDTVNQAQADYSAVRDAAQAQFDAATTDAKAARDAAIASATSFADVVKAVKDYRLATAAQKAELQTALDDAAEALNIVVQNAYDKLIAAGGPYIIWCEDRDGDHNSDGVQIDPVPPVPAEQGLPVAAQDGKRHKDHKKRGH